MTSLLRRYNQAARLLHRHAVVKNASSSRYSSTKSTADELLGRTDAFVFDCDGVIWYDMVKYVLHFKCMLIILGIAAQER